MATPKIVVLKEVPSYNKFFSDEFRFKQNDKFIVKRVEGQYYVLQSIRLKREFTLMKSHFEEKEKVDSIKKIQYD